MSEQDEVKQALRANREALLSRPNVVGVGIGHKVVRSRRTSQLGIVVLDCLEVAI